MAVTELVRNSPTIFRFFAEVVVWPLAQSAELGALPSLRAAADPEATDGQYYGPGGIGELGGHPVVVGSSKRSHDADLQDRLWKVSEELTGVTFPI